MRYLTLPGTDLDVSCISLGTGGLGSAIAREASFAVLDAYAAAGGTFLDTAHVYADWLPGPLHRSETTIGAWLRARGNRARMVVATKGAHPPLSSMSTPRLSPADIISDLDESLECLGLEQIDLYWLHRDDPGRPVGEILETLNAQQRAGKIRHFGCSNWQPERMRAAHAYAAVHGLRSFVASQIFWSLAAPNPGAFAPDIAVMDGTAHAYYTGAGMAVLAFTSQARGWFTKAAARGAPALSAELRRDFENAQTVARLERAQELARRTGTSLTAIVLAYISSQPFPSIPIIGPRNLAQLHDSLAHSDLLLSPEMLRWLQGDPW